MPADQWLPQIIRKPADNAPVNNSTTLVNDTHLLTPVVAGEQLLLELFLQISSSAVADFKCGWGGPYPAGTTIRWERNPNVGGAGTGPTATPLKTETQTVAVGGGGSDFGLILIAWVVVVNTGTLNFQWAQDTAEATNTLTRKNSLMRVTKLA
jgi:hypothetical protein